MSTFCCYSQYTQVTGTGTTLLPVREVATVVVGFCIVETEPVIGVAGFAAASDTTFSEDVVIAEDVRV